MLWQIVDFPVRTRIPNQKSFRARKQKSSDPTTGVSVHLVSQTQASATATQLVVALRVEATRGWGLQTNAALQCPIGRRIPVKKGKKTESAVSFDG